MSDVGSPALGDAGSTAQRARRTQILDACVGLAREGGFDAVRMRAVADGADVALGTLYRYFPSKVHLLVCALARELERTNRELAQRPVPGETSAERVGLLLRGTTRTLQQEPHLTEALVRAFMFADAAVTAEIQAVGVQVTHLLMLAMADPDSPTHAPGPHDLAVVQVIGDVWLASLVQWVTGRVSAAEVAAKLDVAVHLLLTPDG